MGMDQIITIRDPDKLDEYGYYYNAYEFQMRNEKHINNWFDKNVQKIETSVTVPISLEILESLVGDIQTTLKAFGVSEEHGNKVAKNIFVRNHYSEDFDIDFIEAFAQDLEGIQKVITQAYVDIARGIDVQIEYYVDW